MGYRQLTRGERYVMANMLHQGCSYREIAQALDRSVSTISRERRRNACPYDGGYRAEKADSRAMSRRWRSRKKSQYSQQEWDQVAGLLKRKWSPQQIAGRRRLLRLPSMSKYGRKRRGSPATRGRSGDKTPLSARPEAVQRRGRIGHWEGDTVMGADQKHCVLTLVERVSGKTVIRKLSARNKEQASGALIESVRQIGRRKICSITLDNGTEFHDHKRVERHTGVKLYFAQPYHSWERGTNENTNGLIRQYLPKGMCLRHLTQRQCDRIAGELNTRPRERLGFKTPDEVFARS